MLHVTSQRGFVDSRKLWKEIDAFNFFTPIWDGFRDSCKKGALLFIFNFFNKIIFKSRTIITIAIMIFNNSCLEK